MRRKERKRKVSRKDSNGNFRMNPKELFVAKKTSLKLPVKKEEENGKEEGVGQKKKE